MGKPNPFCRPQSRPGESLPTTTTTTTVSPEDIFVIPVSGASCPKVDDTVTTTTVSPGDDITINLPCATTTTSTTTTTTVPGTPINSQWQLRYTAPYDGIINNFVYGVGNFFLASMEIDYGIMPASNPSPPKTLIIITRNPNVWVSYTINPSFNQHVITSNLLVNTYSSESILIAHTNDSIDAQYGGSLFGNENELMGNNWVETFVASRYYPLQTDTDFQCYLTNVQNIYQNKALFQGFGTDKYGNIMYINYYRPSFPSFNSAEIENNYTESNSPFDSIIFKMSQSKITPWKFVVARGSVCQPIDSLNGYGVNDKINWPIYSHTVCHNGNYWIAVGKRSQTSNEQICAISYDDGFNWSIISTITTNVTSYTSINGLSNLVVMNGGLYCFSETRMYRSFNGGFNWDSVALPENGIALPAIAPDTWNLGQRVVVGIKNKIYTYE